MINALDAHCSKHSTSQLRFIKPALIMMICVRGEREEHTSMHLRAVKQMTCGRTCSSRPCTCGMGIWSNEISGITLKLSALKKWASSMHTCSQLVQDVDDMK